ncbi:response regulator [Candidatus Uhrbacteria bacterium]|jgi:CheY-like chemotaxis protein|nr:response regulator [Candidatus Uhrbacteria bacterium]
MVRKFGISGFDVVTARDGAQALDYLDHLDPSPSVIWLDHYLPNMNGLEVLKNIRNSDNWKNIPVFVVTNTSDEKAYEDYLEDGKTYFFVKAEVSLDNTIEKIKKILDK